MCVVFSSIVVQISPLYATMYRESCFLLCWEPTSWRKKLIPEKRLARGLQSEGRRGEAKLEKEELELGLECEG